MVSACFKLAIFVSALAIFIAHASLAVEPTRVEVSRDVWVSAFPSEVEGNNGGSQRLKLKGIQEFSLVDFDPATLQGKTVQRAELIVRIEGTATLDRVTVSTVMSDWSEGDGNNYDKNSSGASFLWARGKQQRWAGESSDLTSVTLGNGGSQWCFGDCSPPDEDHWQRIPIDPSIVQARIDGDSFGFLLVDDLGSEYTRDGNKFEYHLMVNRFLASRDKNRSQAPYFRLWLSDQPSPAKKKDRQAVTVVANHSHEKQKRIEATLSQVAQEPIPEGTLSAKLLNLDLDPLMPHDLSMARGETISFVVDAPPEQVEFDEVNGFDCSIFALPTIGEHYDPTVPMKYWSDPKWKLGRSDAVKTCVDIYSNKTLAPGKRTLTLSIDGKPHVLEIQVWKFTLPDRLSFIPQMNCYGLPEDEIPYFQLCHDHRTTLNRLRYGWSGKVNSAAVPKPNADGAWDWSEWDQHYGPLLDGSAFKDSRRGPIPIEAYYLPLNENWPMDHEHHFRGGYWIENAYDDAYWNEFRTAAKAFAEHLAERDYKETMFEFYLNNKVYFKEQRGGKWDACSAAWIFDEPVNTQDFWALRRFGIEFWKAVENTEGPIFAFRVDISRPEWQRNLLDGVSSVEIVSGSLRQYSERVIERAHRFGNLVSMYGSANSFDSPSSTNVAWCVETWSLGGVGVVPWQTIGTEDSWLHPDPLSVIYPSDFGPIPSLRLKSFRAGQQWVEYLEAYRSALGDVRQEEIGELLRNAMQLDGQTQKSSEADAGSVGYDDAQSARLGKLRFQLGQWLDGQSIKQADSNSPLLRPRAGLSPATPDISPISL